MMVTKWNFEISQIWLEQPSPASFKWHLAPCVPLQLYFWVSIFLWKCPKIWRLTKKMDFPERTPHQPTAAGSNLIGHLTPLPSLPPLVSWVVNPESLKCMFCRVTDVQIRTMATSFWDSFSVWGKVGPAISNLCPIWITFLPNCGFKLYFALHLYDNNTHSLWRRKSSPWVSCEFSLWHNTCVHSAHLQQ